MKLLRFLRNHRCYWGVPHRRASDNQLVMTCYGCGDEKPVSLHLEHKGKDYDGQQFNAVREQ